MSAFGPTPTSPLTPGAVQSSFIAQQGAAVRARERTKQEEVARVRRDVRDEVRLSDPAAAEPVDPKPDAAEEWKHKRPRGERRDPRFPSPDPIVPEEKRKLDIKA